MRKFNKGFTPLEIKEHNEENSERQSRREKEGGIMFRGKRFLRGFTLIEVMVVVAIIGILAAVLIPQVGKMIDKGKVSRAKGDVRSIANAILDFHNDTGKWPTGAAGTSCDLGVSGHYADWLTHPVPSFLSLGCGAGDLIANSHNLAGWEGPYLDKDITYDPWGTPYMYGRFFDELGGSAGSLYSFVYSLGPDGNQDAGTDIAQPGGRTVGGDDIVIWLE